VAYRKRADLLSAQLTNEEVKQLCRLHKNGRPQKQLAEEFGVHRNTVRNVINRAKRNGLYYAVD